METATFLFANHRVGEVTDMWEGIYWDGPRSCGSNVGPWEQAGNTPEKQKPRNPGLSAIQMAEAVRFELMPEALAPLEAADFGASANQK